MVDWSVFVCVGDCRFMDRRRMRLFCTSRLGMSIRNSRLRILGLGGRGAEVPGQHIAPGEYFALQGLSFLDS